MPWLPPGRVLAVVVAPHPVLSTPGAVVDPVGAGVIQLAADLLATQAVSPGCVGLVAQQIGVAWRVFSVDVTGHPKTRTTHGGFVLCNAEVRSATRKERETLGRNYNKDTEWYKQNKSNPEALAIAAQLSEDALLSAATGVHAAAQACKTRVQGATGPATAKTPAAAEVTEVPPLLDGIGDRNSLDGRGWFTGGEERSITCPSPQDARVGSAFCAATIASSAASKTMP